MGQNVIDFLCGLSCPRQHFCHAQAVILVAFAYDAAIFEQKLLR